MAVTRLCYRSKLNYAHMTLPLDEEVDLIISSARRNNARTGITGALLLAGNNFFQVLEGPEETVEETYARLSQDPRHSGPVVIDRRQDTKRLFPDSRLFFTDTMDAYDGVLASLFLPIATAPEQVRYDDLISVLIFSAARIGRSSVDRDVMTA
ncbi:BLUF domain-containing protein [Stappia taiwanensis]|uniref:BLUF domain-containing protein n=1 Tax=Stappia taiwanensis TaxID=992267 RepID=A0A838XNE3_9HYPH|nr:BLUF domain-containing protein [Stappia taiwanensis]MBA4610146.1 BLUF domain-containing protein [Stappia taiwanensis]GGE77248.1 hypothetical protein GCM10007285_01330 [Stappia taiwanensis]